MGREKRQKFISAGGGGDKGGAGRGHGYSVRKKRGVRENGPCKGLEVLTHVWDSVLLNHGKKETGDSENGDEGRAEGMGEHQKKQKKGYSNSERH